MSDLLNALTAPQTLSGPEPLDCRVVLLTHYIPLYQVRVYEEIAKRVRELHVLLSTALEPNRAFAPDWGGLQVRVQKNITLRRRWRDRQSGFRDPLFVHLPYDTLWQLRRLRPDVVLSVELGARSLAAAAYRALNRHSRLVLCTYMSEHTERQRGVLRRLVRRPLLRRADAVTYNGPSCLAYLRDLGVPEERLFHLPYASDDRTHYRGPLQRDEAAVRHRFITVGQLSERKGVLPLVRQLVHYCNQHPSQPIELTLAGEGPLCEAVSGVPRPANFTLRLLGNVPADRLGQELAQHGAALLPTLADEWLVVVNEALQAGLPVIGSRYAQGVEALVRDAVNGWQYDPLQPASLEAALERYFAASNAAIASMRDAARRSVAERTPGFAAAGAIAAIAAIRSRESQA